MHDTTVPLTRKITPRFSGIQTPWTEILEKSVKMSAEWDAAATRVLPVFQDGSPWRYSRPPEADDPDQGWKLHISATILSANEVLKKVAPFLISRNVMFKAPESLKLLFKLNSGLFYGYRQVGKFITVYPKDAEEAVRLARRLHKLTLGLGAPTVPFDLQYRPGSCIYYRYGAFKVQELKIADVGPVAAIRDSAGKLVADMREEPKPSWLTDPFQPIRRSKKSTRTVEETPLMTRYMVFQAIKQRGKGGVYQAIDIGIDPPRLCVVKEGRRLGEVAWDGCDGFGMVEYETHALTALQTVNANVPRFYSAFEAEGNLYLVIEFIEGESLETLMRPRKRRFSLKKTFRYASQIARVLAEIHSAGWVWRDCKPANLIVGVDGSLRPIDFEGASRIGDASFPSWRTIEFSAPEDGLPSSEEASASEDIYSLGTVIYFLLTGKTYNPEAPEPIENLRRDVPVEARELIEKTLALPINRTRPSAKSLVSQFKKLLGQLD